MPKAKGEAHAERPHGGAPATSSLIPQGSASVPVVPTPIGSKVVLFWGYLYRILSLNMSHKKELPMEPMGTGGAYSR